MAENQVHLKLIPRIDYTRKRGALREQQQDEEVAEIVQRLKEELQRVREKHTQSNVKGEPPTKSDNELLAEAAAIQKVNARKRFLRRPPPVLFDPEKIRCALSCHSSSSTRTSVSRARLRKKVYSILYKCPCGLWLQ